MESCSPDRLAKRSGPVAKFSLSPAAYTQTMRTNSCNISLQIKAVLLIICKDLNTFALPICYLRITLISEDRRLEEDAQKSCLQLLMAPVGWPKVIRCDHGPNLPQPSRVSFNILSHFIPLCKVNPLQLFN